MGLLLDTHIIIAIVDGASSGSSRRALEIIKAQSLVSFASVASLWEIEIAARPII
jgi:PIN domain nuclease of toxin-antitoxin system